MKATIIGELTADAGLPQDLQRTFLATMGTKTRQLSEPVRLLYRIKEDEPLARFLESIKSEAGQTTEEQTWVFKNKIVRVENAPISDVVGEILTEVKHVVLHKERVLAKKKRQNELFERLERTSPGRRAPIPEEVRMFVWRRDRGQCVKCGSNEKLEFDHIIPLTEGGSSTERNLQILCESCNREKGRTI